MASAICPGMLAIADRKLPRFLRNSLICRSLNPIHRMKSPNSDPPPSKKDIRSSIASPSAATAAMTTPRGLAIRTALKAATMVVPAFTVAKRPFSPPIRARILRRYVPAITAPRPPNRILTALECSFRNAKPSDRTLNTLLTTGRTATAIVFARDWAVFVN